jgi:hypothetical protein
MLDLLIGNVLSYDNNSINWMATDNPENYKVHCKNLEFKSKWENIDITYILNSQGYRCPDWDKIDWKESVVIFGDSSVAGVGVPKNHTISSFLQTTLQRPVINLGVAGSSNLFSLYNMIRMKTANIKPYAVINVETTPERTLTFCKPETGNTGLRHWGSWNMKDLYYKRFWLGQKENYDMHNNLIRENKKILWLDTKYLNYELLELPTGVFFSARDNLHFGMDTYAKQAKYIKSDWIKNGWLD